MNNADLSRKIARHIFECGDECGDKTQRIAFKGGKYPDNETEMGGLCEASLAGQIWTVLQDNIVDITGPLE